ncbi:MAG: hypothetical protein JW818_10940 [Pirellulales bacterium]|nr:hypothetical protein [Pirellulales bacterium]
MFQWEAGIRGDHLQLGVILELLSWNQAPVARDAYQPQSTMLMVGFKGGLNF